MNEVTVMMLLLSFETNRMKLRFLKMNDLPAIHRQFSDLEMCAYFSEPPCSLQEAEEIIRHYQESEGKGHLHHGMFDKISGAFIGTCGYHYRATEQNELCMALLRQDWR